MENKRIEDAEDLLKWAEKNPEEVMRKLSVWWAQAGRGCRENFFNFSGIIRELKDSSSASEEES